MPEAPDPMVASAAPAGEPSAVAALAATPVAEAPAVVGGTVVEPSAADATIAADAAVAADAVAVAVAATVDAVAAAPATEADPGVAADPADGATEPVADPAPVTAEPVKDPEPVTAEPVGLPVRPRRRRRRVLLALLAALLPVLLVAGTAGALVAWDKGYEGRVLPGVHVGTVDLSGLDRDAAAVAIDAAYPYRDGRLVLAGPDGPIAIAYDAIGRRADTAALVDEALASGRAGSPAERAVAEVRQALDGVVIAPRAVFDRERLAAAVRGAVAGLAQDPVDATIAMTPTGAVTTAARAGRAVDPAPVVEAATQALEAPDAPSELTVDVSTLDVAPAVDDEAVDIARIRAERLVGDIVLTFRDKTWTIRAATVRAWVRFAAAPDGSVGPVVDTATVAASLKKPATFILRKPVEPLFLRARSGRPVGVVAAKDGRSIDAEATVARIAAELERRSGGAAPTAVTVAAKKVAPKTSTEEASRTAPLMVKLGTWTTWFPISERNYYGANIWRPAQLINGTVLAPGQWFDWWKAIWPVTRARGFGPGGVIKSDHTDPTGALGGGMCSSSTTLFNAALRAGLQMGARSNHKYYISRYPLGLDATVSIMGGARQTMSFRNDTGHPIVIRAYRIRGAGGKGYVRYEIWGVDDGRTVSLSRPSVSNLRIATWKTVTVSTLRHGARRVTEVPSNGMTVRVSRVVRNAAGRIIHTETYTTRYIRWNGRIEVGA